MNEQLSSGSQDRREIDGILLLDKPAGISSNAALQRCKRLYKAKKAGHTGSLDPLATGMLPILFGKATKDAQLLLDTDKRYVTEAVLGVTTSSGDAEGEIVNRRLVESYPLSVVESVLQQFNGTIQQVPPMYSALKFKGQPLYKLARQGITVARQPRVITIYELKLLGYKPGVSLSLEIHCSKGTYIRTLVEDIGEKLGCGAHVAQLRRLTVASFTPTQMHTWSTLESMVSAGKDLRMVLLPMEALNNLNQK